MKKPFVEPPRPSGALVESQVGSLIEIRFTGSPSMDEVVTFEAKLVSLVKRVVKEEKRRAVLCTDLRACRVLRPDVSEQVLRLMKNDNPHIERNAFIGVSSASLSLQVQRFISQSGGSGRRQMFAEVSEVVTWLSDVTTIAEQARLRKFLNSGGEAAAE